MAKDITNLSFKEFNALIQKIYDNAKTHRPTHVNEENKKRKQFSSIEELDEYYQSTSAEEFFEEIHRKYGI